MNYYLVNQFNYSAEHKWVFDKKQLSEQVYHGAQIPDKDEVPCWPIGGSNSSYANICKAESDEDIRRFLTSPGDGLDSDDPLLVEIAEYYCSVDVNDNWCDESCTGEIARKLGVQCEDIFDERYKEAEKMIKELQEAGYTDFDYDNPFYGENRYMCYSRLCDLYVEFCDND